MLQLTYISTAVNANDVDVVTILKTSRRNNGRDQVTGLLLFNGKRFLQALEGPSTLVEATYERIKLDQRHRAPVILSSKSVDDRQFGTWDMAFERANAFPRGGSLATEVDNLVAKVADPNIKALFSSYARLRSAA